MAIQSINPATGETVREVEEMTPEKVRKTIEGVHAAFLAWRLTAFAERSERMAEAARVLRRDADAYARQLPLLAGVPASTRARLIETRSGSSSRPRALRNPGSGPRCR